MDKMIDALDPNAIPAGTTCDGIAGYIDHDVNPQSYEQAVSRFPGAVHVKISVRSTVGADVLDVEPGTGQTPQDAVAWVVASRKAGIDPTVYCNQHDPAWGWPACAAAFAAAGVPEPHWWVANYDGDPMIPTGAVAKQWTDLDPQGRNTYDTSSTVPGWPPAAASAAPSPVQEDDMQIIVNPHQPGLLDVGGCSRVRFGCDFSGGVLRVAVHNADGSWRPLVTAGAAISEKDKFSFWLGKGTLTAALKPGDDLVSVVSQSSVPTVARAY